ncbi:hypothetical protein HYZ80_02525 [Candidatus Parcubacteria bacterium]|nr:hypothetical protein [Candidatus Parcubacteria bacterium]
MRFANRKRSIAIENIIDLPKPGVQIREDLESATEGNETYRTLKKESNHEAERFPPHSSTTLLGNAEEDDEVDEKCCCTSSPPRSHFMPLLVLLPTHETLQCP